MAIMCHSLCVGGLALGNCAQCSLCDERQVILWCICHRINRKSATCGLLKNKPCKTSQNIEKGIMYKKTLLKSQYKVFTYVFTYYMVGILYSCMSLVLSGECSRILLKCTRDQSPRLM